MKGLVIVGPYYLSSPATFSHMQFIVRLLFVSLLAVPVVGAPANDAAVAAPLLWMRDAEKLEKVW